MHERVSSGSPLIMASVRKTAFLLVKAGACQNSSSIMEAQIQAFKWVDLSRMHGHAFARMFGDA
jgi:hypothetical protein